MITIKQFLDVVDHAITDTDTWIGYSELAIILSHWDGKQDGKSMDIIFSPTTQEVFAVHVHDFKNQRAYRRQIVGFNNDKEAWNEINYTDLESDEDLLDKMQAIYNNEDYDERVAIPLDMPDDVLLILMKDAHNRDMTFNQYITELIKEKLQQYV